MNADAKLIAQSSGEALVIVALTPPTSSAVPTIAQSTAPIVEPLTRRPCARSNITISEGARYWIRMATPTPSLEME